MHNDDFDDGLVHGHHWANHGPVERDEMPKVADASEVNTPSSVYHDDLMQPE